MAAMQMLGRTRVVSNNLIILQFSQGHVSQRVVCYAVQKKYLQGDSCAGFDVRRDLPEWASCRCFSTASQTWSQSESQSVSADSDNSESDAHNKKPRRLFTGINIYKEGSDPEEKPDSEYPEWLWRLLDPKKPLEELSTSDKEYWKRLRKEKIKTNNFMLKQRRF